jgi:hypothetical protein
MSSGDAPKGALSEASQARLPAVPALELGHYGMVGASVARYTGSDNFGTFILRLKAGG